MESMLRKLTLPQGKDLKPTLSNIHTIDIKITQSGDTATKFSFSVSVIRQISF
ncbi:hypothetical protein [Argonema galeatum]|uniref:hypothetical protein n=1 Tax=Argonema galeatum TaxID=2942762 RepID=UPI002011624D|nr:hypothetical protein [Argonema galeatum]